MTVALVRRWLKVMDPTALTARETLQRALAYGRAIQDVQRSELFSFTWENERDARKILMGLANSTNLLQNPNKHFFEIAWGAEVIRPRGNIWVLVFTPGQGKGLTETLVRHGLVTKPAPEVRRGVLWELTLEVEGRAAMAGEIAVATHHKSGLLANPHVEDVVLFDRPPTAEAVTDALQLKGQKVGK